MKVLSVNLYDDPAKGGGAEVIQHSLVHGLRRRGVDVAILSTRAASGLHRADRDGVSIWRAGLRNLYWPDLKAQPHPAARALWHALDSYNPLMQGYLRQVLAHERPDVVVIHNLPGWSAAAWRTIRRMGIPSVQVLHDSYAICPKSTMFKGGKNCIRQCAGCGVLRLPHRRLSNQVSAVVGVSQFILDRHLDEGYFRNVSLRRVIHNARDADELGVGAPVAPSNAVRGLRIGFIGQLAPTKGVERLLEAFGSLAVSDAELWIAGTGKQDYEQGLRERYVTGPIRFLGRVAPREFYPQVDVVAVPSLWNDTLPGVVFEALAFGKPVIGARRGGIPEMIRDGENGWLFEPDQPDELIAVLRRLARDPRLCQRMSEAARVSAAPFLDRVGWVERYLDLFTELAATACLEDKGSRLHHIEGSKEL